MGALDLDQAFRTLQAQWDANPLEAEALVCAVLDLVRAHTGADSAVLFLGHPSGLAAPWLGRHRDGDLDPAALEEVSRSVVRDALATQRDTHWDVTSGTAGTESAQQLGVVAAYAFPFGAPCCGVVYADYRKLSARLGQGFAAVMPHALRLLQGLLQPPRRPVTMRPSRVPPPSLDELLSLPGMRALRSEATLLLGSTTPVLILGETGTGKTLLAYALAEQMGRTPIVRTMLGTSDDPNTVVSELYGHERGAFSGALNRRAGLVEQAQGGVLVLDEVLNLPLAVQQLLLDFVQFGTYRPLGHAGSSPKRSDARIVAVTNGDLDAAVKAGRFRQDLYYRLAGSVLRLPPLRARRGDIPGVCEMLLRRMEGGAWRLSLAARRALVHEGVAWEGNVRELESVLRRALERACIDPGTAPFELLPRHLGLDGLGVPQAHTARSVAAPRKGDLAAQWKALQDQRETMEREEEALIDEALRTHDQVLAHAAQALGVPRTTLASRVGGGRRGRADRSS